MKKIFSQSVLVLLTAMTIFVSSCKKDNVSNTVTNFGDIVQSLGFANSKGYVVVNNSELVKIVNLDKQGVYISNEGAYQHDNGTVSIIDTVKKSIINNASFNEVAELKISYPRYFLEIDATRAYITSGKYRGSVKIVNLQANTITDSIVVGNGPNQLIKSGNYVYVANNGGWTSDSTVSVIDFTANKLVKSIVVGNDPNELVADVNGDIWVICSDNKANSKIVQISHNTLTVEKYFVEGYANPNRYESKLISISSDKNTIYFQDSLSVYAYPINSTLLTLNTFIKTTTELYGLNVDPSNGDIFCIESGDYSSGGTISIYNKNGTFKKSYIAGIGTSGAYFNY